MYIKPNYVAEIDTSKGETVLFNPINGQIAVIPERLVADYKNLCKKNEYDLTNEILISNFFKEKDSEDENDIMLSIRKRVINSEYMYLTIMPTEKCNFRCVYCYEKFDKGIMKKNTADAIVQYIDRNIEQYRGIVISWFGGEPLLAIEIVEYISDKVIKLCREKRKAFYAMMTTNAYLLDLEMMKRLYNCRVFRFQITIDGAETTHNKQRVLVNGGATYSQIINNLVNIKKNFRKKFIKITIRTNLTQEIINESLDEYFNLISECFANDDLFDFRFRVAWDNYQNRADRNLYISSAKEAYDIVYGKMAEIEGIDFASELDDLKAGGGVCYAAKTNSFVIGSDGTVYKCTVNFQDPINQLGTIRDDGEMDLDKDKISFWTQGDRVDKKCEKCVTKLSCLGIGCPYRDKAGEACGAVTEQMSYILPYIAAFSKKAIHIDNI